MSRYFTEEQTARMVDLYRAGDSLHEIAGKLKRSERSIQRKLAMLRRDGLVGDRRKQPVMSEIPPLSDFGAHA